MASIDSLSPNATFTPNRNKNMHTTTNTPNSTDRDRHMPSVLVGDGHSRSPSLASTITAPPSPSPQHQHQHGESHLMSLGSSSPSSHSSHGQLVLHGSELVAFTSALREMVRTNHVRATRQAALNETNAQLHAMNFFMHYCNAERSQKLEREYASVRESIESGRQMLAHMSSVIASQDESLSSLGSTVTSLSSQQEETTNRVGEMEDALIEQKTQLAQAMAEYENRLAAQEAEFRKQEATLARLLSVRFKMDFGVDMLILLGAWYAAHNSVSSTILNLLGQNVFFRGAVGRRARNRRTRLLVTAVQFATFILLVIKIRRIARQQGLHHAIGGYTKYLSFAAQTAGSAVEMVRGGGRQAITLQEDDDEHDEHKQPDPAAPLSGSGSSLSPVVPAEYRSSAAASLGRSVGGLFLGLLSSGRDSLKFVLNRVVGTGAARDMEIDEQSHTRIHDDATQEAHQHHHQPDIHTHSNEIDPPPVTPRAHPHSPHIDLVHADVYILHGVEGQASAPHVASLPQPSAPAVHLQ